MIRPTTNDSSRAFLQPLVMTGETYGIWIGTQIQFTSSSRYEAIPYMIEGYFTTSSISWNLYEYTPEGFFVDSVLQYNVNNDSYPWTCIGS